METTGRRKAGALATALLTTVTSYSGCAQPPREERPGAVESPTIQAPPPQARIRKFSIPVPDGQKAPPLNGMERIYPCLEIVGTPEGEDKDAKVVYILPLANYTELQQPVRFWITPPDSSGIVEIRCALNREHGGIPPDPRDLSSWSLIARLQNTDPPKPKLESERALGLTKLVSRQDDTITVSHQPLQEVVDQATRGGLVAGQETARPSANATPAPKPSLVPSLPHGIPADEQAARASALQRNPQR